jgi:hypothetical protein
MVNSNTNLTGSGFAARRTLTIAECSTTHWVVTTNPCQRGNRVTIVTNAQGGFVRVYGVELCDGKRGPYPTSQVCYIGHPHPTGIDTMVLLGAVKVIVTYP